MATPPATRKAGLLLALVLTACGGGGGDPGAAPVAPEQTFQLRRAWINSITDQRTLPFTLAGTLSGVSVSGAGTRSGGALVSGSFEGSSVLQTTETVSGTLTGTINGQTVTMPLSTASTVYVDSHYVPLGSSTEDEYAVVSGTPLLPETVKIQDGAVLFTENRYTSSSKAVFLGTATVSYAVLPDGAGTALLQLIETDRDPAGTLTFTTTSTYRMTPAGALTSLSEVGVGGGDTLTVSY